MNVTKINVEDWSYGRVKVTFTISPSIEDVAPTAITSYDMTKQIVGRKWNLIIIQRHFEKGVQFYAKNRIYVGLGTLDLGEHPAYTVKGKDAASDKAWRAFNKLEEKVSRDLIAAFTPAIKAMTTGPSDTYKVSFSRKAGCSMCPCSPGFIVQADTLIRYAGLPVDIWIGEAK